MVRPLALIKFWSMWSKIVYLQSCHVNATFEFKTFSLAWKAAEVTPITEAGDHDIPNNNWPISLLPVLSKVCERVAHNQLSGNKQWHSMEISVIQTTDEILSAINKKKLTAVVLLDLSRAFDIIDNQLLLAAMLQDIGESRSAIECFGHFGKVIVWLQNFQNWRFDVTLNVSAKLHRSQTQS